MSTITSLTPNQVSDELNKMQAFIKKEAEEKAKEIQLKADQEYEIEKSSLVRSETSNIDAVTADKRKKASLQQQIVMSSISNKMRLRALSTREEVLQEIFEAAREKLRDISADETQYRPVLRELTVEALLRLLEPEVVVRVRAADAELLQSMEQEIVERYKEESGRDVALSVSPEHLGKDIAGGVVVTDATGRIVVNNTLEERLKLLNSSALPKIRLELFGPSKSRKFFD
ncbi:AaceriADR358Wp [[Ashbya] aceris (nom. inval.)]|nr:AaceriADR358Wp [[Ashbya] aceris (nom. inval.)]